VEASSALLAFESRLEQLNHFSTLSFQPFVNIAHRDESYFSRRNSFEKNHQWRGPRGGGRNSGRGRSRGRRGSHNQGGGRLFCQLCEKSGHTTATCWHRFDKNFHAPSEPTSSYNFSQQPSALYAEPQTMNDPSWYMDSGASYHVCPNANQFDQFASTGKIYLFTCTGEKANIVGIGNTSLSQSNLSIKNVSTSGLLQ